MNADVDGDGKNLQNTDKDAGKDLKSAVNSDYKELMSADSSDGEVLLNAAYDDGKDLKNADNSDGEVLLDSANNDGEDHLQNTDNNEGKDHLQNGDENDGKDHLQNGVDSDGKALQTADKNDDQEMNDGKEHLQNTDNNDVYALQDADYSDDEDLHNPDNYFGVYPMFEQMYRCYPVSSIDKAHLENGDKVLMPQSALERLAYLEIDFPILFELTNPSSGKVTHCGVLEFTADEGTIFLPAWMMEVMLIKEGDSGLVKYTSLSKGTYVKLQPHTMDFLDISSPKAVLERVLSSYSCLTTGGTIVLPYNDKKYYVNIVETKPSAAVCIIETDCEVEFAPPLDYKEPEKATNTWPEVDEESEKKKLKVGPFSGSGRRLDGKTSTQLVEAVSSSPVLKQHHTNNGSRTIGSTIAKEQPGTLVFGSNANATWKGNRKVSSEEKARDSAQKEEEEKFKAFTGKKYLLKDNVS